MLKVISQSLRQLADDVDEGKFECSKEQMAEVVTQLVEFNTEFLSKACLDQQLKTLITQNIQ